MSVVWPECSVSGLARVLCLWFGLAVRCQAGEDDVGSIPRLGSPFSSVVVVCGHCLVTLPLTVNENGSHRCPSSCKSHAGGDSVV